MGFFRFVAKYAFMAYFNLFYKVDEINKNNIPKKGAYVICSNHVHWMDPLLYVCENRRMVYVIGKEELFSTPLKAFVMKRLGVIPVKREVKGDNTDSLNTAIKRLNEGHLLLIYPEGTRFGFKKGIKPKKGIALIATEAKVPVIPMAMVGSFKPFTKIRFKIGNPIDTTPYYPEEGSNVNLRNMVKLTNVVVDEIIKLRDEINTDEIEKQMNEAEEEREKKKQLKLKQKEPKLTIESSKDDKNE